MTTTTTLPYTNEPPTVYTSSSLMSPDRRELYLGHKSGVRTVHPLPEEATVEITTDPRFPIDLCCVHNGDKKMFVFFSSKMITVAKLKEADPALGTTAVAATNSVKAKSVWLGDDVMSKLPRKKHMRDQTGYDRIPISSTGELQLDANSYPVLPETAKAPFGLATKEWYIWFAILCEYPGSRTTIMKHAEANYFVFQNAYHIVVQEL